MLKLKLILAVDKKLFDYLMIPTNDKFPPDNFTKIRTVKNKHP